MWRIFRLFGKSWENSFDETLWRLSAGFLSLPLSLPLSLSHCFTSLIVNFITFHHSPIHAWLVIGNFPVTSFTPPLAVASSFLTLFISEIEIFSTNYRNAIRVWIDRKVWEIKCTGKVREDERKILSIGKLLTMENKVFNGKKKGKTVSFACLSNRKLIF